MGPILACVDFSEMTKPVIDRAAQLAATSNARLHLLHVAAPEPDLVGYDNDPLASWNRDDRATELTQQHQHLSNLAESVRQRGIEVTPLLVVGPSAKTIIKEATNLSAEIIVIGSHGHGGLYHLLLGSVAAELEKHSPIPLEIVPHAVHE